MAASTAGRRLLVLLALGGVPWTVVLVGDGATLVSPLGLLDVGTGHVVDTYTLVASGGGLPRSRGLLPASLLCYLGALASGALEWVGERTGRVAGDARVTGGLLGLAALAHLGVTHGLIHRLRYAPLPVGVVVVLGLVWWLYGADLRAVWPAAGADGGR